MRASIPQIFDQNMARLAFLENASSVGYELPLNGLWTASFALPADDPKTAYCQPLNYVEIYDGETRIDLFRIVGEDLTRSDETYKVYSCEHVLATLLNDVLFRYHQIGGNNIRTPQVLAYLLNHQTTQRWVLSQCDFARQFEYNFENSNLLAAIFAVPNCFDSEYVWTWNTTVYPWLLSLKAPNENMQAEIRYRKNLLGIKKVTDSSKIVNRIYALGYGEGVNQLGIESVNNGVPYVEDQLSQMNYGVLSSVLVDCRFENADTLKGYAKQILSESSVPYVSYEIESLDLFRLDNDEYGRMWPGRLVRVVDEADGITLRTRVVSVSKYDLRGDPGTITVTLANKDQDIAGSISDLQNRALINETYAQGATNLMIQNFSDNADPEHPARFKVYVPRETARINKMLLNVELESFRGYTKAVEGGGASSDTTASNGSYDDTTATNDTETESTTSVVLEPENVEADDSGGYGRANHNHGIPERTWLATCDSNGNIIGIVGWKASGAHRHDGHRHRVTIPSHYHSFEIPSHRHRFTIPDHIHALSFGIFEGETADSVTIFVDGNQLPNLTAYSDIDIVPYLDKDDAGKIIRGTWHEVVIQPNKKSRIVAALFTQLFTNSRGGGDY